MANHQKVMISLPILNKSVFIIDNIFYVSYSENFLS